MNPGQAAVIVREAHEAQLPDCWDSFHASMLCPGFWLDAAKAIQLIQEKSGCELPEASVAARAVLPELWSGYWSETDERNQPL